MTEKRFWLVPIDYYGEPRFVKDKKLIGEKSMSNQEVVDLLNEQDEELQNLKNQIKIYELFLDQNDLNIEWDLFCTLNYCVNDEDTGCQTCKYMGLIDGDSE